ncbi:ABC transporter ATP-binding protein [Candidatus Gracilibacteria bacterium]|nr:ABC transporter ATP-binding protein [Candidatus Gracilibacteria bacterium]
MQHTLANMPQQGLSRLRSLLRRLSQQLSSKRPVRVVIWLWPYMRPDWRAIVGIVVVTLLLTMVEVATPVLVGVFVDSILLLQLGLPDENGRLRMTVIAVLIAGSILRGWLIARQQALAGRVGERSASRIRNRLWEHIQRLPLHYLRQRAGQVSLRFISDTRMVQRLVTQGLVQLGQDILLAIGVGIALVALNWRMSLGVLVVLPVYLAIFHRLNPQLRRASRATRRRRSRLASYLHDHLGGIVALKAFSRQQDESRRMRGLNRRLANRGMERAAIGGQMQGLAAGQSPVAARWCSCWLLSKLRLGASPAAHSSPSTPCSACSSPFFSASFWQTECFRRPMSR